MRDPYYLVVEEKSYLASLKEVWGGWESTSLFQPMRVLTWEAPSMRSFADSAGWIPTPGNQMAIALVEKGLGITVLPGLTLIDLIPNRAVKIIPLKDR